MCVCVCRHISELQGYLVMERLAGFKQRELLVLIFFGQLRQGCWSNMHDICWNKEALPLECSPI